MNRFVTFFVALMSLARHACTARAANTDRDSATKIKDTLGKDFGGPVVAQHQRVDSQLQNNPVHQLAFNDATTAGSDMLGMLPSNQWPQRRWSNLIDSEGRLQPEVEHTNGVAAAVESVLYKSNEAAVRAESAADNAQALADAGKALVDAEKALVDAQAAADAQAVYDELVWSPTASNLTVGEIHKSTQAMIALATGALENARKALTEKAISLYRKNKAQNESSHDIVMGEENRDELGHEFEKQMVSAMGREVFEKEARHNRQLVAEARLEGERLQAELSKSRSWRWLW